MRLSAPTNKTFLLALVAIVAGIALWVTEPGGDITPDAAYWLTAAGAVLLVIGCMFKRI